MARITEKKTETVEKLKQELVNYPIIGLVRIDNINARVVQTMRSEIRKDAKIVMAKNSLMKRALEKAKIDELGEYVQGSGGIILTDMDPFKLNKLMVSTKTTAPAKPGSIANKDIVIPAGDTPLGEPARPKL